MMGKIAAGLAIVGSIYGAGAVIHTHAENQTHKIIEPVKKLSEMNYAEQRVMFYDGVLQAEMKQPKEQRTEYQQMKIDEFKAQKQQWIEHANELQKQVTIQK